MDNNLKKIKGEYEINDGEINYAFKDLLIDTNTLHLKGTVESKEKNKKGKFEINLGASNQSEGDYWAYYAEDDDEDIYAVLSSLYQSFNIKTDVKQDGNDISIEIKMKYVGQKSKNKT
jgi:hypothetical protein